MKTSGSPESIGMRRAAWALAAAWLTACAAPPSAPSGVVCPYAPWYQHPYRHGAVPTREAQQKILAWEASRRAAQAPVSAATLVFGGGVDGVGVTSGVPRVYLVFYGSQWTSGGDPGGAAAYLQRLFQGIGTGGEQWSGTMTQYCDGPTVPQGASSCTPVNTPHVGYPDGGALAGVWFDTEAPSPASATPAQLAQEAVRAAQHFANLSAAANRYAHYLIVSPSGTHPDGFGNAGQNFCAWHDYTPSRFGDIAYANMPYVSDLGSSCGTGFVNPGGAGALDGFSIVAGHEYAEILTNQNPPGGWTTPAGEETGDECAWIASGQGASANVAMGNGAFAMQSTWSNDTGQCEIAHARL
jgi:serine protease